MHFTKVNYVSFFNFTFIFQALQILLHFQYCISNIVSSLKREGYFGRSSGETFSNNPYTLILEVLVLSYFQNILY